MAGTKEGGKKAANTNVEKYGNDFYARIGRKGGKAGHTGGFAANPELAKEAGRIGGRKSRRGIGPHSGTTSLRSLLTQCNRRAYESIKVRLEDGLVVTIAASQIEELAIKCGADKSFEQAFESLTVVPS